MGQYFIRESNNQANYDLYSKIFEFSFRDDDGELKINELTKNEICGKDKTEDSYYKNSKSQTNQAEDYYTNSKSYYSPTVMFKTDVISNYKNLCKKFG